MILSKQKNKLFSLFQTLFVRPSRNRRKFFVLGALILVLILFFPRPAHAGAIGEAVIAILWAVIYACKLFVALAARALAFMLRGDIYYFANEPMILVGWKICRDLCNLFFLLILIFIAFCTILQIEKYHAKKTLLTLIIMALLINFSKPIAIFIFDGSQLLMNYFIGNTDNWTVTITNLSRVSDIVYGGLPTFWDRWGDYLIWGTGGIDDGKMVLMQITVIIFTFMYAVALFVMAVYLFIRLVALWIIIILSPFAFLFAVVPDFKKYSDEWWSALFKYCYTGPILAFFLYLSTKLAESKFLEFADKDKAEKIGEIISLGNFVHFIVVIVFLYASIIMAQKLGIAFASGITSRANKVLGAIPRSIGKGAWSGTKYAAKAGVRKLDRDVLGSWSPRAFVKGWQKAAEDVERRHLEPGAAGWEDSINKAFGRKKPKDYAKNVQFQSDVEKEMKEQRNVSTQDEALIGVIEKFKGDKSQEARAKTASAMRLLFENNDQNEYMKQYILKNPKEFDDGIQAMTETRLRNERKEGKKQIDDGGTLRDETDDEFEKRLEEDLKKVKIDKNAGHNPDALRAALEYGLRRTGMNEDEIGRELFQLGNIALPKGNLGNYGMGTYDAKTEQYKISDSKTNRDHALAKARNIDSQEKMKRLHWNAIFTENQHNPETGQIDKVGDIHQTGLELLSQMKQTEIKQLNRSRPDLIENCYTGRDKITAAANDYEAKAAAETDKTKAEEMRNIAKNMHSFVKKVEEEFIGKQNEEAGGTKKKVDRTIKDEYDMDY